MKHSEIIQALQDVRATITILLEAVSNMEIGTDQSPNFQINDHDDLSKSDQSGSDQIRSDQIRAYAGNFCSNEVKFRAIAKDSGVDLDMYDLSSIQRNITWFVEHSGTINQPQKYIQRMISELKPQTGFRQRPIPDPPKEDDTKCMGYDIDLLDRYLPDLDSSIFQMVRHLIPGHEQVFKNWESVCDSTMKKRVVAAYCFKQGIFITET